MRDLVSLSLQPSDALVKTDIVGQYSTSGQPVDLAKSQGPRRAGQSPVSAHSPTRADRADRMLIGSRVIRMVGVLVERRLFGLVGMMLGRRLIGMAGMLIGTRVIRTVGVLVGRRVIGMVGMFIESPVNGIAGMSIGGGGLE